MTKLVCIMCGGSNVQELAWINPNTKKYIEPFSKKKMMLELGVMIVKMVIN